MNPWDNLDLMRHPAALAGGSGTPRQRTRRLLDEVTALTLVKSTRTFWRGLSKPSYRLDPSLLHSHPLGAPPTTSREVERAAQALVDAAKAGTHLWREGVTFRGIHDLETLALLQHFGESTPLLDLTADPLVALFFASRRNPDKDGILVGWNAVGWRDFTGFEYSYAAAISELSADQSMGWMVPPVVSDRVVVQRSRMLIAPVTPEIRYWASGITSLLLPDLPPGWSSQQLGALVAARGRGRRAMPAFVGFRVPRGLKPYILEILSESFGISHLTLFPDPAGYAERSRVVSP